MAAGGDAKLGVTLWRSKLRRLRTLSARQRKRREAEEARSARASALAADELPAPAAGDDAPLRKGHRASKRPAAPVDSAAQPAAKRPVEPEVVDLTVEMAAEAREPQPQAPPVAEVVPDTTPQRPRKRPRAAVASATSVLALRVTLPHQRASGRPGAGVQAKPPPPPPEPPAPPPPKAHEASGPAERSASSPPAPKAKLDAAAEIQRILAAAGPEELLNLSTTGPLTEDTVIQAWKRLMLLLHPDKLHRLRPEEREAGAEALQRVHAAKDELRRRSQEACAQVPLPPTPVGPPRCLESAQGQRKYEISWRLQEAQDPTRPVENYEIWGPRYFSEIGDPYDWVLLATLPALQSQFILVEEAPTQQDCMWAADRILRPFLPIAVHASNGKGQSEPLTFELPWATAFPWLRGTPSVLCTQCFRMSMCRGPWTKCSGCMASVASDFRIIVRCQECQGEVLWAQGTTMLRCTCCLKVFGKDCGPHWRPGTKHFHDNVPPPRGATRVPPPPRRPTSRGPMPPPPPRY